MCLQEEKGERDRDRQRGRGEREQVRYIYVPLVTRYQVLQVIMYHTCLEAQSMYVYKYIFKKKTFKNTHKKKSNNFETYLKKVHVKIIAQN